MQILTRPAAAAGLLLMAGGIALAVTFTTIAQGSQSGIEEQREVVVRTPEEWKALWSRHAPGEPVPSVDFDKSMVLGVFLGRRNTGGFAATITGIEREGETLVVTWRESAPSPRDIVTQVLTAPYHLVRAERSEAKVTFRRAKS